MGCKCSCLYTIHTVVCNVVTCDEARLAATEEEQQRLLQVVEQWKKMFHARGMQISQSQNENKQLQDKCECMCVDVCTTS